jgi:hypothetical protein
LGGTSEANLGVHSEESHHLPQETPGLETPLMLSKTAMNVVLAALSFCLLAGPARAGDLHPPPGPISPTDRVRIDPSTLPLPITIDEPGSYVLVGDLAGQAKLDGIYISASNVTLDLNGFSLLGVEGAGVAINTFSAGSVTIRNGTITEWAIGVTGSGDGSSGVVRCEDIAVSECFGQGFLLPDGAQLLRCAATSCGSMGFWLGSACHVMQCVATGNGANAKAGFNGGFSTNTGCIFVDCTAESNAGDGFLGTSGCRWMNCVSNQNGGAGFSAGDSSLSSCSASQNLSAGIFIDGGATVDRCTLASNFVVGIQATGAGACIDSCTIKGSGIGIEVTGTGSLIIRNRSSGATTANYQIGAGNTFGPIVNAVGAGNLASVSDASHPWANFEY